MLSMADACDRSMRRAIETGDMDFIHTVQREEGHDPCFGRTEEPCTQMVCRWHAQCVAAADAGRDGSVGGGETEILERGVERRESLRVVS